MKPVSSLSVEREVYGRRDPDARGYFGAYDGRFVPETLVAPIEELTAGYLAARADPSFRAAAETLGASIRRDAADGRLLAELEDLELPCQVPQNV